MKPQACQMDECDGEAADGEDYCELCRQVYTDYLRDLARARAWGEGFDRWEGVSLTLDVLHGLAGRKMYAEGHRGVA